MQVPNKRAGELFEMILSKCLNSTPSTSVYSGLYVYNNPYLYCFTVTMMAQRKEQGADTEGKVGSSTFYGKQQPKKDDTTYEVSNIHKCKNEYLKSYSKKSRNLQKEENSSG